MPPSPGKLSVSPEARSPIIRESKPRSSTSEWLAWSDARGYALTFATTARTLAVTSSLSPLGAASAGVLALDWALGAGASEPAAILRVIWTSSLTGQ